MAGFVRNLILLVVIVAAVFMLFPQTMRDVVGVFGGIGILPVFVLLLVLSAIPRRRWRGPYRVWRWPRRRWWR